MIDVRIAYGNEADAQLADPAFLAAWNALHDECPWATGAQTAGFARAWYAAYRHTGEPVLLLAHREGRLAGLLALVHIRGSKRFTHAGLGQAEYHAWLCGDQDAETFPTAALAVLRQRWSGATLHFGNLSPGIPLGWLAALPERHLVIEHRSSRPWVDLGDEATLAAWRRKGRLRDKLRQLERLGSVTLRHLTDPAECDALLATMIPWCDARQEAVHGRAPFRTDPGKRPFHEALFRTGALHVTGLYAGDRLIAANLGGVGHGDVQIGVIAHDPVFGRYSPGTLLIRMLAELLRAEGYSRLDLTAGGDAYKDRLATGQDELVALTFSPGARSAALARLTLRVRNRLEEWLAKRDISRRDVKLALQKVRQADTADVRAWMTAALRPSSTAVRPGLWHLEHRRKTGSAKLPPDTVIACDSLDDLLAYDRTCPGMTRQSFLSDALRRIEAGQRVWTAMQGGRLTGWLWLVPVLDERTRASMFAGVPPACTGRALVADCHVAPGSRRRGLARALLAAALDSTADDGQGLFATVPSATAATTAWLTGGGFAPATVPAEGADPEPAQHQAL